jgi:hypothetical protein
MVRVNGKDIRCGICGDLHIFGHTKDQEIPKKMFDELLELKLKGHTEKYIRKRKAELLGRLKK